MHRKLHLSLILISGLVLFFLLLLAAYKEVTPEWKQYQTEYKQLFSKSARDDFMRQKAESFDIGIKQIYLADLDKVDRCTICHLGVENPLMAEAKLPYRQHSGDYLNNHPIEKFGCTTCHYGQGQATNKKEAHGEGRDTHWDYPIMPLKYVQSSCADCHDYEMLRAKGGDRVANGEKLFREKGCRGCHKLDNIGGVLGKPLDGIGTQPIGYFPMLHIQGDHTSYTWMKEHFDDPRIVVPGSEMRAFLAGDDADLLTTYILTLKSTERPRAYRRIQPQVVKEAEGETLYKMYCFACHSSGKFSVYDEIFKRTIPAIMNPAFVKTIDDQYLKKMVEEGRSDTQMTAWKADAAGLTDREIDKIVNYLTSVRPKEKSAPFGFSGFTSDDKRGGELFGIHCTSCHGKNGKGGEGLLGIDLKNPMVQNADPEFLAITVRDGRPGTPMAPFGTTGLKLEDRDIADLVAYVKTLSRKK